MAYDTSSWNSSGWRPGAKNAGDVIDADTFQQMLNVLDDLTDHSHTVTDDYTSVCQCNCACACACACGRGIV